MSSELLGFSPCFAHLEKKLYSTRHILSLFWYLLVQLLQLSLKCRLPKLSSRNGTPSWPLAQNSEWPNILRFTRSKNAFKTSRKLLSTDLVNGKYTYRGTVFLMVAVIHTDQVKTVKMKVVYRGCCHAYSASFRREMFLATLLIGWFVVESTAVTRLQGRFLKLFSRFHYYAPLNLFRGEKATYIGPLSCSE